MQVSNTRHADDPLRRFREGWRLKARNARDTWLPGTGPLEAALESTFREGVAFATGILEEEGHRELASKIRMRVERKAWRRGIGRAARDAAAKRPPSREVAIAFGHHELGGQARKREW